MPAIVPALGLIAALGLLASCSSTARQPAPAPLAAPAGAPSLDGTAWQLVRIQSMDDRVFTPEERGKYTLTFEPGGRLLVRADCNRGQGSWSREGESGLTFGTVATTRAACPPGSLHDRFMSDLGYVRSFVAKDGHIFLATMADGAILEFEPLPDQPAAGAAPGA